MEKEKLWQIALNGEPFASAVALALLDKELGGKLSELLEKIKRGGANGAFEDKY